jgi:isoleucyl-tRNA synthetase
VNTLVLRHRVYKINKTKMSQNINNYKDTLNLPKTSFPMKANLAQREPEMLNAWEKQNIYQQIRDARKGARKEGKRFILHDGPPYANGDIHIGHAVNKILKDIIIKSKTLSGFDVPFIPGWDCHGLPIEHQVEKKIGKAGSKKTHKEFRDACRVYARKQIDKQRSDFKRLGIFGEWDEPYRTMDFSFEADIVRAIGKIYSKGHIVRGFKPVYWSVVGGSALAEAEVEYQNKNSFAIDVCFSIVNQNVFLKHISNVTGEGPVSVIIWTTTPWTLPSNQAVSLNPDLDYVLIGYKLENTKKRLLLADALHETCMQRYEIDDYKIVGKCKGKDLENLQLQHPFYDKTVPIILGDHVTTETGTGAVHTAPDHGVDDFNVGKKYNIGTLNLVDDYGVFKEDTELFAGEHVYKVDEKIIETLIAKNKLVHQSKFQHSFPHCWRTKTPLIYRATPQWFISMGAENLLTEVNKQVPKVEWIPEWGEARIKGMLASSPDWCISRQRTWGVPIPFFIDKNTEQPHPRTVEFIEQIAQKIEQGGMDAWYELDIAKILGDEADRYKKVTDTLDVWFDSGVTHYAVAQKRLGVDQDSGDRVDLYLEGSDQHRGWFQSSLKTAVAMYGHAPYKQVLTHGFVVDADGKKMSKSLGNVVAPQKICNSLGGDILRLWVAATDYSGELTVSDEILNRTSDAYRRIRNTLRYLLSNLDGFNPSTDQIAAKDMIAIDFWIVCKTAQLQEEIIAYYEKYQFHRIYNLIHNFCVLELGSDYLDIIKDRQYTCQTKSQARRSSQTAQYHMVEAITRWIAPILSFTAEEVWQHIPGEGKDSVFIQQWYNLDEFETYGEITDTDWDGILEAKEIISKQLEELRNKKEIGSSLDAEVKIWNAPGYLKKISNDELRFAFITSYADLAKGSAPNNAQKLTNADGTEYYINVKKSLYSKCARCWHHREDVGKNSQHPELCSRCVSNLPNGPGESRLYA